MRTNGILCALSSLPSKYGVGSFGDEARQFIKILKDSKIKIWQLLPINILGDGNSPYSSTCGNAIDHIYTDLDALYDEKLISKPRKFDEFSIFCKFEEVREYKNKYLKVAFKNQKDVGSKEYNEFIKNNPWVIDYAKFSVLSDKNKLKPWYEWSKKEKEASYNNFDFSKYQNKMDFYIWVQFKLFSQFNEFKKFANDNGVLLMGDTPFYVGGNSVEVWSNQDNFLLQENGEADFIAGCPPDVFSKTGQRWGFPVYDFDFMKQDNYQYWIDRIVSASKLYDFIRIDHFRAFDTYYCIPHTCPTAEIGEWKEAPGREIFKLIEKLNLKSEIVAEDLGDLFPSVLELRDMFNLKGMNIIQFTMFNPLAENKEQQIIYTGTHDNDTIVSFYKKLSKEEKEQVKIIFEMNDIKGKSVKDKFIEYALKGKADYAIIPVQDIIGLDNKARMNLPGTLLDTNWTFKLKDFKELKKALKPYVLLLEKYNRV